MTSDTSVRERVLNACVELVFAPPRRAASAARWEGSPGAALRLAPSAAAFNFAPGRWLVVDAERAEFDDATAAGAMVVDVEGKWRCLQIVDADAGAMLSAGVNVHAILDGRDCAAVSLFDCPVVIGRWPDDQTLRVFVTASHVFSLRAALARVRMQVAAT